MTRRSPESEIGIRRSLRPTVNSAEPDEAGLISDPTRVKQRRTNMIMLDRLMLQRAGSAAGGASHQISSLLVLFLATVLMASPPLAPSTNVHRNVRAQHVWQAKKAPADY